jgi:YgiT-type zinc finger domain-containing protein
MCKQAEPQPGRATVTFRRDEFELLVREVPALVCALCGEAYTDEETSTRLLECAREMEVAGVKKEDMVFTAG